MPDYNREVFDEIKAMVRQGHDIGTAAAACGQDPKKIKRWIEVNKTLKTEINQAKAQHIVELREKMSNEESAAKRSLLARELEAADPTFSRSAAQNYKNQMDKEAANRERKLKQNLGQVTCGFCGWQLRKREAVRKLQEGKLDEKALRILYAWALSKDLQDRYEYDLKVVPLMDEKTVKRVAKVFTGKRQLSKPEKALMTEKQTEVVGVSSPQPVGAAHVGLVEVNWVKNKG